VIEPRTTSGPELGNLYPPSDHAGLFRRFAILAIDLGVVLLAFVAIKAVQLFFQPEDSSRITRTEFWIWVGFSYAYFVLLEASALGTLGFFLTGVKIVTLKGERPSILRMTFRLLLWILGPINAVVDFYWLTGDDCKQTLRDKFAGTLVIRKDAVPAGVGPIRLNRYHFLGQSFVFYEVVGPAARSVGS